MTNRLSRSIIVISCVILVLGSNAVKPANEPILTIDRDTAINNAVQYMGLKDTMDFSKSDNLGSVRIDVVDIKAIPIWKGNRESNSDSVWIIGLRNINLCKHLNIIIPNDFEVWIDAISGRLLKIESDTVCFASLGLADSIYHPTNELNYDEIWDDTTNIYGIPECCPNTSLSDIIGSISPNSNMAIYQFSAVLVDYSRPLVDRGIKWIISMRGVSYDDTYEPHNYAVLDANTGKVEYFSRKAIRKCE